MNDFAFENGQLCLGKGDVPTHVLADCVKHEVMLEPKDDFIAPGLTIRHRGGRITGRRPSGGVEFTFECTRSLSSWTIDHRRLFAHDILGCVHMFAFDQTQAQTVRLGAVPLGWCIVPNTNSVVHWTAHTSQVTDVTTHKQTPLHCGSITAAAATTCMLVTGESTGLLRIWYVASWSCHYQCLLDTTPILQIAIDGDKAYVRQSHKITSVNLLTGCVVDNIKMESVAILPNAFGLVVATKNKVLVYKHMIFVFGLAVPTKQIFSAVHDRVWILRNKKALHLSLGREEAAWPRECIEWAKNPTWDVDIRRWPLRYLNALAISAEQWVPLVKKWDAPTFLFKHRTLRQAICRVILDNGIDVPNIDMLLSPHHVNEWYQKCRAHLCQKMKTSMEFSEPTFRLLEQIYPHISLDEPVIYKWCWFHHGRLCMRPILIYFGDHDNAGQYFSTIVNEPISPDAVLAFSPVGASVALKQHRILFLLECFQRYHAHYPHPPTQYMYSIFTIMLLHVGKYLTQDNFDVPLEDTGEWHSAPNWTPAHKGAYIRVLQDHGFITDVVVEEETRTTYWRPHHSMRSSKLTEPLVEYWKFHKQKGPRTLLDIAFELLSKEQWTQMDVLTPFEWFRSETGAFLATGANIKLFEETLNVVHAEWTESGASMSTQNHLAITEAEQVPLKWQTALWSYLDKNAYALQLLQLRICNTVVLTSHTPYVPIRYAQELLSCCVTPPIEHGGTWRVKWRTTAMFTYANMLYVGSQNGLVYEFDSISDVDMPTRSFMAHECAIEQMQIKWSKLYTLSEELFAVWCLRSGACIWSLPAQDIFHAFVIDSKQTAWVVTSNEAHPSIVRWHIDSQSPLKRIDTANISKHIFAFDEPAPGILMGDVVQWFESDISISIPTIEDITAVKGHHKTLFGGTHKGTIFTLVGDDFTRWSPLDQENAITCMDYLNKTELLVFGTRSGSVYAWDTEEHYIVYDISIGRTAVQCIVSDAIFLLAACHKTIHFLSVIDSRAILSMHVFQNALSWSPAWRARLIMDASTYIEPAIAYCLLNNKAVQQAVSVLEQCTQEYQDRASWCSPEFIDILLAAPIKHTKSILRRLASFRGPRFECVICGDDESDDTISYIKRCQHRFHTGCIHEHIRKTPELHQEMQYEYALSVELKCPTCRCTFEESDVVEDKYLNKHLNVKYRLFKK